MYVWVDALTNYITADRLSGRMRPGAELLAGCARQRRACHRQGHHALPRDLLAGVPDVGRRSVALAGVSSTGSCSTAARKCRSRSATCSTRSSSCDTYGVDPVRYFVLREVAFRAATASYSATRRSCTRINADLANDLGNLAQRSLTMVAKNLRGAVPKPGATRGSPTEALTEPFSPRRQGSPQKARGADG